MQRIGPLVVGCLLFLVGCQPVHQPPAIKTLEPVILPTSQPVFELIRFDTEDRVELEGSAPAFYLVDGGPGLGLVLFHSEQWSGKIKLFLGQEERTAERNSPGISSIQFWEEGRYLLLIEPDTATAVSMDIAIANTP